MVARMFDLRCPAWSMEMDFLCADVGLVIEWDGAQHLADPAAYRRDLQKDVLLQEQGFFVLRFLAEDLAKELDAILDTILRNLAHPARHRRVHLHQDDSAPAIPAQAAKHLMRIGSCADTRDKCRKLL